MHSPLPDPKLGEPEPYESPAEVAGDLNVSLLGVVDPLEPGLVAPFALPELVDPGIRYDAIVDRIELLSGQMPVKLLGCLGLEDDPLRYRLAANLAARLARGGRRVTIVEAEFGRSMLGTDPSERDGLIDMLLYGCSYPAVARWSGIAGVQVVTAGSHPWSGEPIHADEWERVLGAFRNHSDLTLITASTAFPAPVLSMLARRLDWILIAYTLGRASRHAIRCSYLTLWDMDAPILGLVAEPPRAQGWPADGSLLDSASASEESATGTKMRELGRIMEEIDSGEVVVRRTLDADFPPPSRSSAQEPSMDWARTFLEPEQSEEPKQSGKPGTSGEPGQLGEPEQLEQPERPPAESTEDAGPATSGWFDDVPSLENSTETVIREARAIEPSAADLWGEEVARLRPAESTGWGPRDAGVSDEAGAWGTEATERAAEETKADRATDEEVAEGALRIEKGLPPSGQESLPQSAQNPAEGALEAAANTFESAWEKAVDDAPTVDEIENGLAAVLSPVVPSPATTQVPRLDPGWPGLPPPMPPVREAAPLAEPEESPAISASSETRDEGAVSEQSWGDDSPVPVREGEDELGWGEEAPDAVQEIATTPDWAETFGLREPIGYARGKGNAIEDLEKELIGEHVKEVMATESKPTPWRVLVPGVLVGLIAVLFWAFQNEVIRFQPRPQSAKPAASMTSGTSNGEETSASTPGVTDDSDASSEPGAEPGAKGELGAKAEPGAKVEPGPKVEPGAKGKSDGAQGLGAASGGEVGPSPATGTSKVPAPPPPPASTIPETGPESDTPRTSGGSTPPAPGAGSPGEGESVGSPGATVSDRLSGYGVHVSSFQTQVKANEDLARYQAIGYKGVIVIVKVPDKGDWRRVVLGPYPTMEEAASVAVAIREDGLSPKAQAIPLGR